MKSFILEVLWAAGDTMRRFAREWGYAVFWAVVLVGSSWLTLYLWHDRWDEQEQEQQHQLEVLERIADALEKGEK